MKISELADKLRDGAAALVVSEENRFYLTGFASSDGFLLVTKSGSAFITDSRYIEAAEKCIKPYGTADGGCRVVLQGELYAQLAELLNEFGVREVLIEASRLSVSQAARFKERISEEFAKLSDKFPELKFTETDELDKYISDLRVIKTSSEKEKILKAQRIAESAFKDVLRIIKPGITERNIAAELEYRMRKRGADGVSFDTIAVTGASTSKPHGVPGDTPVASGDFVTLDFGALYEGYRSDTTRTVAVGGVSPEMANVYDIVLKAQLAGVAGLKPGLRTKDADALCRNVIKEAGFGKYFGHGTGHGVGVEIHESPTLSPRSEEVLTEGNIVTVEPGIYIEGKFGVRIEDMLYITADGAENLTSLSKELTVL